VTVRDALAAARRTATLPVVHSVLAAEAVGREVGRGYAIAPAACRLLRAGTNDSYLLSADGFTHLVRIYGASDGAEHEIGDELRLLRHLCEGGVDVGVPVPDRTGRLVRPVDAPEGRRQLVVFTHVEGPPLSWDDPADCRLVGRAAAQIHAGSDGFTPRRRRSRLDAERLLDASLAAVAPFLAHRPADRAELAATAERLRAEISAEAVAGLDRGACHGDLSVRTVTRRAGGAPFAFGFDLCGTGWRAFDLAAVHRAAAAGRGGGVWTAFLDGYAEVRPLAPPDLAAVPLFQAVRELWRLGMFARNAPQWGAAALSDDYLDRKLAFFRRWASERGPAR
jgi:Ser/Thr protein kinase RdoA (MazF antagonist)